MCALLVLFLFAVCQRAISPSREASMKMHPEIVPRLLPESECKGTTILNTDQIFRELFYEEIEKNLVLNKKEEKTGAKWRPFSSFSGNKAPKDLLFEKMLVEVFLYTSD
jgi:hypothetical protein